MQSAVSLGPPEFPRLPLHLEVLVAFGTAEPKHLGVIADKNDTLGGVYRTRTQMACLNPSKDVSASASTMSTTFNEPHLCGRRSTSRVLVGMKGWVDAIDSRKSLTNQWYTLIMNVTRLNLRMGSNAGRLQACTQNVKPKILAKAFTLGGVCGAVERTLVSARAQKNRAQRAHATGAGKSVRLWRWKARGPKGTYTHGAGKITGPGERTLVEPTTFRVS